MKHVIVQTIGAVLAPEARSILETMGTVHDAVPGEDIKGPLADATVLVTSIGTRIHAGLLEHAPHLTVIATATTGTDHIDEEYAAKRGIAVLSLKGETEFLRSVTATAELALGLMIGLARSIAPAARAVLDGKWVTTDFRGMQLQGKTLGIIGIGRLGTMMAGYASALGMKVVGTDISAIKVNTCLQVSLEELLSQSDIISLHTPLHTTTERMIDQAAVAKMKSGALLVNTARGKIVDEAAVLASLQRGHLGGYATDVLDNEVVFGKDCSKHPLVQYAKNHGNVLITPHIGGMTDESRIATDVFIARKLQEFLQ